MKLVSQIVAGAVAGAVGAYAGLFALLSVTGLHEASWAPVAMVTGAALFGTTTVMLIARASVAVVVGSAVAAAIIGAVAGSIVRSISDNYEWMVAASLLIVGTAVVAAHTVARGYAGD